MLAHGILSQMQYAAETAVPAPAWVTDGLIGYWDATNTDSYPGSGTTWTDLSSTGANLAYQSTPSYGAAGTNTPAYFSIDSTSDSNAYFSVTNSTLAEVSNGGAMTVQALVYITTFGTPSVSYIAGNDSNSNGAWRVKAQVLSSLNKFALQPWDSLDNAFNIVNTNAGGLSNGRWYFVTATNDWSAGSGTAATAPVDLVTTSTSTSTPNGSKSTFTIGKAPSLSDLFKGRISAVMVYNKVLSGAEITQNYNAIRDQYTTAVTPTAARYWRYTVTYVPSSATHHPRVARIDMYDDTTATWYNFRTDAADNCSDSGIIPGALGQPGYYDTVTPIDKDFGTDRSMTKVRFYVSYGGGFREADVTISYSTNGSTWTSFGIFTAAANSCGLKEFDLVTV